MLATKRIMDVAIIGVVVLDVVLTSVFVTHRRHSQVQSVERQSVVKQVDLKASTSQIAATTNASDTAAAMFLLLRERDTGGAEPYVCPSSNAQRWDYGGGKNTAQNWVNWSSTTSAGVLVDEPYSYQDPYPQARGVPTTAGTAEDATSSAYSKGLRLSREIQSEFNVESDLPTTQK